MGDSLGGTKRFIGRLWNEARTSLYRNAIYLMATSVVGQALGFFFWAIVTHVYLTEDIGFAVTLFSTIGFVSTFALLGFNASLIRYLPEAEDQGNLLNTTLTLVGISSILLGMGFLLVIAVLGLNLSFVLATPWYPLMILLGVLACALGPVFDAAAIALRRSDVGMLRAVALGLLKIPIAVALALTLSQTLGIGRFGIFAALVIAMAGSVLLEGIWLMPRVLPGFRPALRMGFARLRIMMRFSNGNYAAGVITSAGGGLFPLLILLVLGPGGVSDAAYFYVASAVASLVSVISGSTFTSFFAEASYRNANRHRDERRALLLTLGLLIPAIAVFWIFAHLVLELFGGASSAYADAATTPLRILTLAAIPAVANNLLATRVRVRRRTLPLIVGSAIAAVVGLGAGYVLLRTNGITGLAVASVLASVAPTPYYWLVARKSFETEPLEPLEPVLVQP